jgi:hypothetical protein
MFLLACPPSFGIIHLYISLLSQPPHSLTDEATAVRTSTFFGGTLWGCYLYSNDLDCLFALCFCGVRVSGCCFSGVIFSSFL